MAMEKPGCFTKIRNWEKSYFLLFFVYFLPESNNYFQYCFVSFSFTIKDLNIQTTNTFAVNTL